MILAVVYAQSLRASQISNLKCLSIYPASQYDTEVSRNAPLFVGLRISSASLVNGVFQPRYGLHDSLASSASENISFNLRLTLHREKAGT